MLLPEAEEGRAEPPQSARANVRIVFLLVTGVSTGDDQGDHRSASTSPPESRGWGSIYTRRLGRDPNSGRGPTNPGARTPRTMRPTNGLGPFQLAIETRHAVADGAFAVTGCPRTASDLQRVGLGRPRIPPAVLVVHGQGIGGLAHDVRRAALQLQHPAPRHFGVVELARAARDERECAQRLGLDHRPPRDATPRRRARGAPTSPPASAKHSLRLLQPSAAQVDSPETQRLARAARCGRALPPASGRSAR